MNANFDSALSFLSSCASSVATGSKNIGNAVVDGAKTYGRFVKAYSMFLPSLIIASTTGGDRSETHKKFLNLIGERTVEQSTEKESV